MIDFPDMVPLVCPTCRTEAPLGSRFCGMCGQPLGPAERRDSSPGPTLSGSSRPDADRDDVEPQRAHSEPPSAGHEVRASSPDRRVQTSPVGTVLPDDVLSVLHAATSDRAADRAVDRAVDRADETPRRARPAAGSSQSSGRSSGRPPRTPQPNVETAPQFVAMSSGSRDRAQPSGVPRSVADEPTVPISYRPTQTRAGFGLLRSVLFGLLWLLLAGLVAMLVVWVLPERQPERQPERSMEHPSPLQPQAMSPATSVRSEPARTARPTSKPSASSSPGALSPALPSQAGSASLQPAGSASASVPPSGLPAVPPSSASAASPAMTTAQTAPANEDRPLSAAERAAWQQDLANIEFVASTYSAQVRACYERAVRGLGGEPPRGRVELVFTLSDVGMAQNVAVSDDTLGLPVLQSCLSQRVSEWRFPRPVGPLRTFRFPFAFSGSKP